MTAPGPAQACKVEIEFSAGTWTDVSAYIVAEAPQSGHFGRATVFDDVTPISWSVQLRNEDGRFTPTNGSGAYSPNVVRGRRMRVTFTAPSSSTYTRCTLYITDWVVSFPGGEVHRAICTVTAADVLANMGRRTLDRPFIEEANRLARAAAGGCDVFPMTVAAVNLDPASAAAQTQLENRGTGGSLGSLTLIRSIVASPDAPGDIQSEGADSVLNCDRLAFTPTPNNTGGWTGGVLKYVPQGSLTVLELFVRVPKDFFIPSGDGYERTIVQAWAGTTALFSVRLAKTSRGVVTFKVDTIGTVFTGGSGNLGDVCDGAWRKLTITHTGGVVVNDGQFSSGAGSITLSTADSIYFGGARNDTATAGKQNRCADVAIGGIIGQTANVTVPMNVSLGAPAPVADSTRLGELAAYLAQPTVSTGVDGATSTNVARTEITGRTLLDVVQEMARTCAGYVYVSTAGTVTLARPDASYRTASQFAITLDADDDGSGALQWVDSVSTNPTRVTVTFPQGSATAINATAEAAGAYADQSVQTAAVSQSAAATLASALLGSGEKIWPTQLVIDLVHAQTDLWAALMSMRPGTRITIAGLPSAVLGSSSVDVIVQGWTEEHMQDQARFTLDMTPA